MGFKSEKKMGFESKNMNYIFNVEYFNGIEDMLFKEETSKEVEKKVKERNEQIESFSFAGCKVPFAELENSSCEKRFSYRSFQLYTQYPGLLIGIGYPHETKLNGAIKCGFSFDYVTGLPYISGSALKGMLRSFFYTDENNSEIAKEYESYIKELINKGDSFDIQQIKDQIFENNDVFLGAYPDIKKDSKGILKMEYITPHKEFMNPNPISMIKVKPNVLFLFGFLLTDYMVDGKVILSAEEKLNLFEKLIVNMGIGAKTNVGFGKFSKRKVVENYFVKMDQR